MSASHKEMPAGHPSTTAPIAFPCDSPQVVTLKIVPKDEPAILFPPFVFMLDAPEYTASACDWQEKNRVLSGKWRNCRENGIRCLADARLLHIVR